MTELVKWLNSNQKFISDVVQVGLVFLGAFVLYFVGRIAFRWLDRKFPQFKFEDGWLKSLIDAPKRHLVFGLFCILFGIIIINLSVAATNIGVKLSGLVLTEFGFAFFIAFMLHVTVDMQARIEHDRQISKGVLSYLYGIRLDDKMFSAAEKYLFQSEFYRKNMRVEYEFIRIQEDRVLLKYSLEYDIVNVSEHDRNFDLKTMVEKSERQDTNWGQNLELGLHRIAINGKGLTDDELDKARNITQDDPNFIQSLHALKLAAGESARIKTVSFLEKCDRDSEFWRSVYPADGVEVKLVWRAEMGLRVKVDAIHPGIHFDQDPHSEPGLVEAKLSRPLFPYNGVLFWWSRDSACDSCG